MQSASALYPALHSMRQVGVQLGLTPMGSQDPLRSGRGSIQALQLPTAPLITNAIGDLVAPSPKRAQYSAGEGHLRLLLSAMGEFGRSATLSPDAVRLGIPSG
jgi:hypothetical protein